VLVVDDEATVREVARVTLSRAGYRPLTAAGGAAAVALLAAGHDVRLAVVDINMPDMGGPQTMRELRRLRPGLPLVAISGMDPGDLGRAGLAPPASFLAKPFPAGALAEAVRRGLAGE
jgi:two-component system, cell cycle sensor histidine kinase and response regulator CckA